MLTFIEYFYFNMESYYHTCDGHNLYLHYLLKTIFPFL